jgi:hypothetical protein
LSLWLRERLLPHEEHRARVGAFCYFLGVWNIPSLNKRLIDVGLLFLEVVVLTASEEAWLTRRFSKVDWEVSIEVNSLLSNLSSLKLSKPLGSCFSSGVSILSDWSDRLVVGPVFFDQSQAVDVQCWDEVILVIFQQLLSGRILVYHTLL